MSIYSFRCPNCGCWLYLARNMANCDDPAPCPQFQAPLQRRPDATQGLLDISGSARPPESSPRTGTINIINYTAIANGGAAIRASGGHLNIRGMTAIDNGGPAFHLSGGATVDVDGVTHIARDSRNASSQKKKSRKGRSRRG